MPLKSLPCCVLAAMLPLATFGCSPMMRAEQADRGEQVAVDELLHDHLQKQPAVTVAEAYRVMVLLAQGDDPFESFEQRRDWLESQAIARPEWKLQRTACIDKGSVAYMTCQVLKIRGGVNLRLVGRPLHLGDRRYAVRELVYLDLMPETSAHRYITGGELVDLAMRADRRMAEQGQYATTLHNVGELLVHD